MFPLRRCGGKPLVAVTREQRYGPSRLRVNDDDGRLLFKFLLLNNGTSIYCAHSEGPLNRQLQYLTGRNQSLGYILPQTLHVCYRHFRVAVTGFGKTHFPILDHISCLSSQGSSSWGTELHQYFGKYSPIVCSVKVYFLFVL